MSDHAPGSVLHKTETAAEAYEPDAAEVALSQQPPVEEQYVVQVRETRATHTIYNTFVIPAGGMLRLLGRNKDRRSAIISCVSGTVIICANGELAGAVQAQALSGVPTAQIPGAWLASGTPGAAVPIESVNQVIGVATTNAAAVVAVVEEHWDA